MSDTPEFRVQVRVRNNRLIKLREARGWNQSEAAREIGVSASTLGRLENLKDSAYIKKTGKVRVPAKKICDFFRVLVEDIFPPGLDGVTTTSMETEVSLGGLLELSGVVPDPRLLDDGAERRLLEGKVQSVLTTLTERERIVVEMSFGIGVDEATLEEIGLALDPQVGKSRAKEILEGALQKLRQPGRADVLRKWPHFYLLWESDKEWDAAEKRVREVRGVPG
jgi:DNA-binding XRE family transcriptional regulator